MATTSILRAGLARCLFVAAVACGLAAAGSAAHAQGCSAAVSGTITVAGTVTFTCILAANESLLVTANGNITAVGDGVSVAVPIGTIENHGLIDAQGGAALRLDGASLTGPIVNTGTLQGTRSLYITNPFGPVTVDNTGSLVGLVEMQNTTLNINADNLRISGSVLGDAASTINVNGNLTTHGDFTAGNLSIATGKTLTTTHQFMVLDFQNNGTFRIAPTGTNSVSGNYSQSAGATLGLTVRSLMDYSRLVVGGTGSFAAGTHMFVDVQGAALQSGNVLAGVVETGARSASTFQVSDNSFFYRFLAALNANGTDVDLVVLQDSTIADAVPSGPNAGAAAELDAALASSSPNPFGALTSAAQVAAAVAQTVPSTAAAAPAAVIGVADQIGRIVKDEGLCGKTLVTSGCLWLKPFGAFADQAGTGGLPGFDSSTYGIVGGLDGAVTAEARFGIALAYARVDLDGTEAAALQSLDIDSYQIAAYGSYAFGPRTELRLLGNAGLNEHESRRGLAFGTLNTSSDADFDSWNLGVRADLGHTLALGARTSLTPRATIDYNRVRAEAYTESGADELSLAVRSQTAAQLIFGLGARLEHYFTPALSFAASADIGHDVLADDMILVARFLGGGDAFATAGREVSDWVVRTGAALTYKAGDGLDLSLRYDRDDYGPDFDSQAVSGKARLTF